MTLHFLKMLDVLNENLIAEKKEAVVFDSDCREGICGSCSLMINGIAHGPQPATTTCQLHMRTFNSNDTIVIEPWRAVAFPIIKDLMVDRSAFDRIIEVGGFITVPTGAANLFTGAKLAHLNLLPQGQAERFKRTEAMVERMDDFFALMTRTTSRPSSRTAKNSAAISR